MEHTNWKCDGWSKIDKFWVELQGSTAKVHIKYTGRVDIPVFHERSWSETRWSIEDMIDGHVEVKQAKPVFENPDCKTDCLECAHRRKQIERCSSDNVHGDEKDLVRKSERAAENRLREWEKVRKEEKRWAKKRKRAAFWEAAKRECRANEKRKKERRDRKEFLNGLGDGKPVKKTRTGSGGKLRTQSRPSERKCKDQERSTSNKDHEYGHDHEQMRELPSNKKLPRQVQDDVQAKNRERVTVPKTPVQENTAAAEKNIEEVSQILRASHRRGRGAKSKENANRQDQKTKDKEVDEEAEEPGKVQRKPEENASRGNDTQEPSQSGGILKLISVGLVLLALQRVCPKLRKWFGI